jgi:hypothetical protein
MQKEVQHQAKQRDAQGVPQSRLQDTAMIMTAAMLTQVSDFSGLAKLAHHQIYDKTYGNADEQLAQQ